MAAIGEASRGANYSSLVIIISFYELRHFILWLFWARTCTCFLRLSASNANQVLAATVTTSHTKNWCAQIISYNTLGSESPSENGLNCCIIVRIMTYIFDISTSCSKAYQCYISNGHIEANQDVDNGNPSNCNTNDKFRGYIEFTKASAFGFVERQQIGEFKKLTGEFVQNVINRQQSPNSDNVEQFRILTAQFERDVIIAILDDQPSISCGR